MSVYVYDNNYLFKCVSNQLYLIKEITLVEVFCRATWM